MCIQTFCDHLEVLYVFEQTDLNCFEVKPVLYGANACLVVIPPSLSPSHPPTPSPSRWPDLTTLPPLTKFQLVRRRLCEALLSSSSLVGQKRPSLLSRLCLKYRRCKRRFALNMKIKSSIPLEALLLKASPADIRQVCVCPPALRKLRTYDVDFSNDA